MDTKTGIYICTGCDIGKVIDIDDLKETVDDELDFEELHIDPMVCGECVERIKKDIEEKDLNRVVIGACSGRYFAERFDFGPDVLIDRVPLREYVAWTHDPADYDEDDYDDKYEFPIQEMAADYLRVAIAKMKNSEPPMPMDEEITKDIMVVGGGVAGMSAALASARVGYKVVLVEKESELGGWARSFRWVFPSEPPFEKPTESPHTLLAREVVENDNITVYTSSKILKTEGQPGQFDVTIQNGSGDVNFRIGAIVQATGWKPYNADLLKDKYGYGKLPNVMTNVELEKMVSSGGIKRPSDGKAPKSVAIIHCAGSRDKEFLPYCSAVCCRAALKQAMYIHDELPDTDVYLLYKDIRTPGVYEQFYEAVQQVEGVYLTKGEVVEVSECGSDGVKVALGDTLLGEPITVDADMMVLTTGMLPEAKLVEDEPTEEEEEEKKDDTEEKEKEDPLKDPTNILNLTYMQGTDMPTLKYGFPDSHYICFPYETRRTGIYAAGAVRAPMDIMTARNDGLGAALKAIQVLESADRGMAVHPRSGDLTFPDLFLQRCTQCKRCTQECPFGAYDEDEKGTPKPNPTRCRRCGICLGACPERIISFTNFSPNMVSQMIKVIEIPDEDEEKPRILAFLCENDAIPALDITAMYRIKMPDTIRIIPVRCIGSVNTVWIADALSAGFDGILMLGCQRGDDYQCHYIRGSELAQTRMKNVKEKLEQLVLESERVRIESVEISDWELIAKIFNEFAEEIGEMDPNPYKGL